MSYPDPNTPSSPHPAMPAERRAEPPSPTPRPRPASRLAVLRCGLLLALAALVLCLLPACRQDQDDPANDAPQHDVAAGTVGVMTFNIRYATESDGENAWSVRRDFVVDVIRKYGADFVGLQEVLPIQRRYLESKLADDYSSFGRSREQNPLVGEACPIYYRHATWDIDGRRQGQFWLSESPDWAGSKSWGAVCPRIVTWARFTHRESGKVLYVYNTHFSRVSAEARDKSVRLLAQRVARRGEDAPFVITGDLNCSELSEPMRWLFSKASGLDVVDSFRVVHPDTQDVLTYNGFRGGVVGAKIDYVLTGAGVRVRAAEILRESRQRRFPSDHYPVTARLILP